jgi:hypothetical protein
MYCVTITDAHLETLQWVSLIYYLRESNRENGLVADKTMKGSPASIAAVGFSLASLPVVVEREILDREAAAEIALKKLRFFRESPQGPELDSTGYKGFYYHFLDMNSGRRVWDCEISTVDTAFLIAGVLTVAAYFDQENPVEAQIRETADFLYRRVDWKWALNGEAAMSHGWRPETGFIPYRYEGYDEALLLYVLALGSPTYPIDPSSYAAWSSTFQWKKVYDWEYLYSGPLFTHQLSHLFLDLNHISDAFMRTRGIDYFENTRRATYIQREYAIKNPLDLVVASLPFAPEIVLPTIQHFNSLDLGMTDSYGFKASFNPTFEVEGSHCGWVSPYYFGIDQGPLVLMIENYRTGLLWSVTKRSPYIVEGLRRAGFQGGWLE